MPRDHKLNEVKPSERLYERYNILSSGKSEYSDLILNGGGNELDSPSLNYKQVPIASSPVSPSIVVDD